MPHTSPVVPPPGPIVTPISSVASAMVPGAHTAPDSAAEATLGSGAASRNAPHPQDELAESSSTAVGFRESELGVKEQTAVPEHQNEFAAQRDSAQHAGQRLVDSLVLPCGTSMTSCAAPDGSTRAAEAEAVIPSPLLVTEPFTCIVDAREAAASAAVECAAGHHADEVAPGPEDTVDLSLPAERDHECATASEVR